MSRTLEILAESFSICQLAAMPSSFQDGFLFFAKTDREYSLVCETSRVPCNAVKCEDNWRAFRFAGTLDFSLTGILSGISSLLADAHIGIFAISTFDTDYILVRQEQLEAAKQVLGHAGYVFL